MFSLCPLIWRSAALMSTGSVLTAMIDSAYCLEVTRRMRIKSQAALELAGPYCLPSPEIGRPSVESLSMSPLWRDFY
ncbi:hypothetical protein RRG08_034358 [Elysia crispata]|uniref:Uncharacterized protein n=1 Tax=Elysia crispata TaxID=231223 RepID=A0AAE0YEI7_9GAST|nr:hypothetical protein RRG08_034358 [Elysia crispata]